MLYFKKIVSGFTLVELIVVITILAILGTIAFVSFQGYAASSRDGKRVNDVKVIQKGLSLYQTRENTLPIPDDVITITSSGRTIGYQGYIGEDVLRTIKQAGVIIDPVFNIPYSYYVSSSRLKSQILAYTERRDVAFRNGTNILYSQGYASLVYQDTYPITFGDSLGILTNIDNSPIMEINTPPTDINVEDTLGIDYIAHFRGGKKLQGNQDVLFQLHAYKDCQSILDLNESYGSTSYSIGQIGDANKIYCDMTTDGGGWMAASMLADQITKNLFNTGIDESVASITTDISSKGSLSKLWTDDDDKDVMIRCVTESTDHAGYEIPFIMRNYLKSDINNLERQDKAPTTGTNPFSTNPIQADWNGNNITLQPFYYSSSDETSIQIRDENIDVCFRLSAGYSLIVGNTLSYSPDCPAYNPSFSTYNQYLDVNNYCVVYLR